MNRDRINRIDSLVRALNEVEKFEKKNVFEKQEILLAKIEDEVKEIRLRFEMYKDIQSKREINQSSVYSISKLKKI